jgi:hypothetical protein
MRIFTLYVIEYFQVASAIEFCKKSICAFCPTASSPHSPLLGDGDYTVKKQMNITRGY